MAGASLTSAGLARLDEVMTRHVETGAVPGLVWLVAQGRTVHAGAAGTLDVASGAPAGRDAIFRISSMSKPVTAVAALVLVEECRLRLDDPVDDLLPELADRRVLARPDRPLDDTVPAARPITLRDLLTFRLGLGADFTAPHPQPSMTRAAELGLGVGPPAPAVPPEPDEFMRRLGSLPLEHQPGERWLYHTGADVLGVLIARAAGQPFPEFLAERVCEPLGMVDTGFWVPPADLDRFGPCYSTDPVTGERAVYDPTDGQWSAPPAFPGGGAGLVSTADDMAAFGEMLRSGGVREGTRVLSRAAVAAMTRNHLTRAQLAAGPDPSGAVGWGFGVGVQVRATGLDRSVGGYGWDGGMGTRWSNDPAEDLTAVLMTNQMWTSPAPPAVARDFLTCAYTALA
ncbi:MAG TPA: serine hydrolase domain-containing protein [Acidimicrobiales bacterium]|nr:serine hydrolase domain-containing protein [Acidimicrobiales bacterium]